MKCRRRVLFCRSAYYLQLHKAKELWCLANTHDAMEDDVLLHLHQAARHNLAPSLTVPKSCCHVPGRMHVICMPLRNTYLFTRNTAKSPNTQQPQCVQQSMWMYTRFACQCRDKP